EVDWYKFTASTTGLYTFQATTPLSNVDTVAAVYSQAGGRIAYNDDVSTTSTDSRFTANMIAGRVYYFGVTNYLNTPGGNYSWKVDGPGPSPTPPPPPSGDDAYEQNDTRIAGYNLGTITAPKTINNLIMADGHDWYKFATTLTGTASSSVTINFSDAQ